MEEHSTEALVLKTKFISRDINFFHVLKFLMMESIGGRTQNHVKHLKISILQK